MTLKIDTKFKEKLICCFKNDKNFAKIDPNTRKSQKFALYWFLLCKKFNENLQRSYASWQSWMMQNLKKKLTCCFKVDMRNLTNFEPSTLNSKDFHFNALLLSKVYIVCAKKLQRRYLSRYWRGIQNLERNWLVI